MKVVSKEVFIKSPGPGTLVWGDSFYTRAKSGEKMRARSFMTRSDTLDSRDVSFSSDNGRTWSDRQATPVATKTPSGTYRKYPAQSFVDPEKDRLVTIVLEGLLPNDAPLEGMKAYHLSYRVSADGGKTNAVEEQVIQKGFTADHPFECVWVGKNCIMTGSGPYFRSRAHCTMIFPMQVTPVGPDGEYHNPGGGYTWTEAVCLIGRWSDGLRIDWEISSRVAIDPAKSTRGAIEPTVAEMPSGRMLMVMRGSNDVKPEFPGHKWYCISESGGRSWTKPEPWTYSDRTPFYSPSAISRFVQHSNGRTYWLGNITQENPRGNSPRYPLVIGEVNPASMLLEKGSVVVVDDLQSGEDPSLQLSNFTAHEDRETGEILLHLSRFITKGFHGDAMLYRVAVS